MVVKLSCTFCHKTTSETQRLTYKSSTDRYVLSGSASATQKLKYSCFTYKYVLSQRLPYNRYVPSESASATQRQIYNSCTYRNVPSMASRPRDHRPRCSGGSCSRYRQWVSASSQPEGQWQTPSHHRELLIQASSSGHRWRQSVSDMSVGCNADLRMTSESVVGSEEVQNAVIRLGIQDQSNSLKESDRHTYKWHTPFSGI